jgi:Ni,Fe-hydrogenase III large subunit
MHHPEPFLLCDLRQHNSLSISELARQCHQALHANSVLISLFGRAAGHQEPAGVVVTAVLLAHTGALQVLRGHAEPGQTYPSLTAEFAAAQIFERELWEQTGLVPEGHPWLKPVRFESTRQEHMGDYPFFKVRGAEVHEVGVGPIHAGVIEPGHFRFMCHGEQVHHLEIQLGYQHRGVEAQLLRRSTQASIHTLTPLVESVCGDSALAYAWGHCAALEFLSNQPAVLATQASRAIGLEMERMAIHVATLNGLATDIAFLQGGASYGRLRTALINASQRVCGNRFGRGWVRPGSARPITDVLRQDLSQTLRQFSTDFDEVNDLMRSARSVQARFKGVGTVSTQAALDMGLTGVVARASGVALDLRHTLPSEVYGKHPVTTVSEPGGDCWARMSQRMREVDASVAWLLARLGDAQLDLQPPAPTRPTGAVSPSPWALQPNALCVSLVEGVRGPVLQALETDAAGQLRHYKVQDPSLTNWFGLAFALRNQGISDFPICNKSFDLSYCGNDL